MYRRYQLLMARSAMLERCRFCEPTVACCESGCEIFDDVTQAIEEGLTDINPCTYCPAGKVSCYGWDSLRPNPYSIQGKEEKPSQVGKAEGKVINPRDDNLQIKLALLFQKVKGGTNIAIAPKSKKLGTTLEKHGLIVEYSF